MSEERDDVLPLVTPAIETRELGMERRGVSILSDIDLELPAGSVTAFIGPSGCGKSTLLRCFNRLIELDPRVRVRGEISLFGRDIFAPEQSVSELRRQIGLVFEVPNTFHMSVFENVAFGLRLQGVRNRRMLAEKVEHALIMTGLWEEVRGRLDANALELSHGQQQRLMLARAIVVEPKVLLLDEPASALDPISTLRIEELIVSLKTRYTVVTVTHNMQQAARISDYTAFLDSGRLIEFGATDEVFTNPKARATEDYITGRYG